MDLTGKVVLLTGATDGIGKAAALELAARGARLSIVGRNRDKSERVLAELKATGNPDIELYLADLSSQAEVRKLAADFRSRHDRLDVLANNAGALFQRYRTTADGFELTFALNHLSYFLLTELLLDLLKATPSARVVNTSSGAHRGARFDLDDLPQRKRTQSAGFPAYCDSKLANVLFTRELAKRLADSDAVASCFHPGFVHTQFGQNDPGVVAWGIRVAAPIFGRTPEKGARTLVWLATSPEAARSNGDYFLDCSVASTSQLAKDSGLAARLWALSAELCGAR